MSATPRKKRNLVEAKTGSHPPIERLFLLNSVPTTWPLQNFTREEELQRTNKYLEPGSAVVTATLRRMIPPIKQLKLPSDSTLQRRSAKRDEATAEGLRYRLELHPPRSICTGNAEPHNPTIRGCSLLLHSFALHVFDESHCGR